MDKRICVLEDSEEILGIIGILLEEENYEVFGFGTVAEFLSEVGGLRPDVCLLDIMLPDGNGLEVCKELKAREDTSHIPVIMMTAYAQIEKMKDNSEADDFITKPFDINDLVLRVNFQANR